MINVNLHNGTPTYNELSLGMRTMIAEGVSIACDVVNDESIEPGSNLSINDVKLSSEMQVRLMLDPENGNTELSQVIKQAISEYVTQHLHFQLKFY